MAADKNRPTIMRVIELRQRLISSLVRKKSDRPTSEFEKSKLVNQQADRIRANDRLRGLFAEYNRLRSDLVENNLLLVHKYTRIYHNKTGLSYDDLFQCGLIGMTLAIDKFDGREDVKLTSYAVWWIRQRLQEYMRNELLNPEERMISLSFLDEFGNREDWPPPTYEDTTVEANENVTEAEKLLSVLNGRDKEIVSMKFGLGGHPQMTQREIAALLGLSGSRIQQIVDRAIKLLRRRGGAAPLLAGESTGGR